MVAPLTQQFIQWVLVALTALGIATSSGIQTRDDLHVEAKHGTSARAVILTKGYQEAWYSSRQEKILLLNCPIPCFPKSTCAGMILSARNYTLTRRGVTDYRQQGLLEITCFFGARTYWLNVIRRDGYVRIY